MDNDGSVLLHQMRFFVCSVCMTSSVLVFITDIIFEGQMFLVVSNEAHKY